MPAAKTYKCGTCQDPINKSDHSIQCKGCKSWLHLPCANIEKKHLDLIKEKPNVFSFKCFTCTSDANTEKPIWEEMRALKISFDDFAKSGKQDFSNFTDTVEKIFSDFKKEVSANIKELKNDIVNCNKLINNLDSATSSKFSCVERENHILHRRLNRADIVITGLPAGLNKITPVVISICSYYGIDISEFNLNNVCYINHNKQVLVKFNNVDLRDRLMKEYFKNRSLQLKNVMDGNIETRVYLNDHYSPGASNLNLLCRKLLHHNIILKYKIINRDELKAKLTLKDGKEVLYDVGGCAELLNDNSDN